MIARARLFARRSVLVFYGVSAPQPMGRVDSVRRTSGMAMGSVGGSLHTLALAACSLICLVFWCGMVGGWWLARGVTGDSQTYLSQVGSAHARPTHASGPSDVMPDASPSGSLLDLMKNQRVHLGGDACSTASMQLHNELQHLRVTRCANTAILVCVGRDEPETHDLGL